MRTDIEHAYEHEPALCVYAYTCIHANKDKHTNRCDCLRLLIVCYKIKIIYKEYITHVKLYTIPSYEAVARNLDLGACNFAVLMIFVYPC